MGRGPVAGGSCSTDTHTITSQPQKSRRAITPRRTGTPTSTSTSTMLAEPHTEAAHRHHGGSALGVGFIHGAAGTGHLLGVLPALALPTAQAVVYLVAYGLAAIAAMASFGALMGTVGHRLRPEGLRLTLAFVGALAIAIGVFWIATGWPQG